MAKSKKIKEEVASLVHDIWAEWWKYQKRYTISLFYNEKDPESLRIDPYKVTRWNRQANTPYEELPPEEQRSDLEIAERYLEIFEKYNSEEQLLQMIPAPKINLIVGDNVVIKRGNALGLGTVIAFSSNGEVLVSWETVGLSLHDAESLEIVKTDELYKW